jgi:D-arabinose 1-dehydrogenase-like Zn-dependent alcohol dehydrogenase
MKNVILWIGGLGHMAIQNSNAMDCEVTALSSSVENEELEKI